MAEKPILFSSPMVRAIIEGRKTQTRRIVKQPNEMGAAGAPISVAPFNTVAPERGLAYYWKSNGSWNSTQPIKTHAAGDVLWVKETFKDLSDYMTAPAFQDRTNPIAFRADQEFIGCHAWTPSIFMPRKLSRITLKITEVRIERLHDITDADVMAEGCTKAPSGGFVFRGTDYDKAGLCHSEPELAFAALWIEINGEGSWLFNPWVAAYTFEKVG